MPKFESRIIVGCGLLWALSGCAVSGSSRSDVKDPGAESKASKKPEPEPKGPTEQEKLAAKRSEQNARVRKADSLSGRERYEEARALYLEVLEESPERHEIQLRLGNVELHLGHTEAALAAFETGYFLGAKSERLPLSIAELWLRLDDMAQATAWLERAIAARPDDAELRLRQAQILLIADQPEAARSQAQQLLTHEEPSIVRGAHALLGYVALSLGDEPLARKHWDAAADGGLAHKEILLFLANRHFESEDYDGAARRFEAYLALSDDETAHRHLVVSLARAGELGEAKTELMRYFEKYPKSEHGKELALAVNAHE
jgi:tetratricopeptide (TPR) repeat protein